MITSRLCGHTQTVLLRNFGCLALAAWLAIGSTDGLAGSCDWEFTNTNSTEGWKGDGVIDNGVSSGVWKLSVTRGNPHIFTPPVEIDAGNQGFVKFRMRLGKGLAAKGCILFITEEHPQWDDRTIVSFDCHSDGEMHEYEVDMSKNPLWKGKVTQLRFQPFAAQWPLPEPQRTVEIASFRVINLAEATGNYGFSGSDAKSATPSASTVTCTNTLSVQYIRLENQGGGGVNFSELYAYDADKTNVALRKPVRVSNPAWGDGSLGNDGNCAHNNHVMIRSLTNNWWEVDLGKEMPLTHVVIHDRNAGSLNGAVFSILDHERNPVASCLMNAKEMKAEPAVTANSVDSRTTIPMDKEYFHQRDLTTRFGVKSDSPGNIFAASEGTLRLVVPEPKTLASGSVTLSDLEGRNLRTITLSRGKGEYAIPLPGKGYYTVTATATYDGGLTLKKESSAAVIGEPLDSPTRLKTIFGIQGTPGRAFNELGAAWSWAGVHTHHTFKSGSGYGWAPTYADRIKNGKLDLSPEVNNIFLFEWLPEYLQSVPPAQRGNCPTSSPNDYEEFARFIKWVTSFIPDFVKYVLVIGEHTWCFKGSPEELVRYHAVAIKAIREVRPDIHVIGPMTSPGNSHGFECMKALDKAGMFTLVDGASFNPYLVEWPTPVRSRMPEADFIEYVDSIIRHFASSGRPDYPIYLTEFGWFEGPVSKKLDDPKDVARFSSRAALLLATRPTIKLANFFNMGPDEWGYCWLKSDGTPRPVYPAMAHTFRWLADCSNGVSTRLTPTLYLAAFKKGNGGGVAIWDTQGDSAVTGMRGDSGVFNTIRAWFANVPTNPIKRIEDMMGREVVSKNGKLMTSPSPLFIDLSDDSLWACVSSPATAPNVMLMAGESAEVGAFDDVLMPEVFVRKGTTITAAANAVPGEYRLLGKADGKWRMVTLTISQPTKKSASK